MRRCEGAQEATYREFRGIYFREIRNLLIRLRLGVRESASGRGPQEAQHLAVVIMMRLLSMRSRLVQVSGRRHHQHLVILTTLLLQERLALLLCLVITILSASIDSQCVSLRIYAKPASMSSCWQCTALMQGIKVCMAQRHPHALQASAHARSQSQSMHLRKAQAVMLSSSPSEDVPEVGAQDEEHKGHILRQQDPAAGVGHGAGAQEGRDCADGQAQRSHIPQQSAPRLGAPVDQHDGPRHDRPHKQAAACR